VQQVGDELVSSVGDVLGLRATADPEPGNDQDTIAARPSIPNDHPK